MARILSNRFEVRLDRKFKGRYPRFYKKYYFKSKSKANNLVKKVDKDKFEVMGPYPTHYRKDWD